ncbi:hybrid sensor histidine kinase/response regulator [Terrihabitans soli]|uniref:Chemotaxis protein CheA n=1 Tax=Terrihabitans soli TaxID=708113 RepID=A0A6S6QYY4_9HYPH|nr:response regulator [Terrihabitans soli]BCJ92241.1 hybrid sensor histidine kinase/response regulator [Terrihabitans soli]
MAKDPFKYFRPEAQEIVDQFGKCLLDIEKGAEQAAAVQKLLRLAHTLKGAARVVKQSEIAHLAHKIEDSLSPYRSSAQALSREDVDALLERIDAITGLVPALTEPPPEEQEAGSPRPAGEERIQTVRADIGETQVLLDAVSETHALLNGLRGVVHELDNSRDLADLLAVQLSSPASAERSRVPTVAFVQRSATIEDLRRRLRTAERMLGTTLERMDREFRSLRDTAHRLRLVPVSSLFTVLERTARDAARALSKDVRFEGRSGDIRIDAHMIETIQNALIQLVRNAVAHGIEMPRERLAAGKTGAGQICVTVSRSGRKIVFACSDDGRGIDFRAVRKIAMERGLAGAEADDGQLIGILLAGGISTSQTVTGISGRGIGLDIVRECVEKLGGEIRLSGTPGSGTAFELVMPSSLASVEALVVEPSARAAPIAIPLEAVLRTRRLAASEISWTAQGMSIAHGDEEIPFVPLQAALQTDTGEPRLGGTAIIVAGALGRAAIGVERLIGTGDIVVRPLPGNIAASPIIAGASLDAAGNPQLVLDPDILVAAARNAGFHPVASLKEKTRVLVVDDSLTTRMLEQSILESAGYDVDVAMSGEEGLERMRARRYALVLVDVEMPGMDGFSFVEHLRADPALHDIPALLVTSLSGPEHIQRGREAGAQGHIAKSEFDQATLLSMIAPLAVGHE